MKKKVGTLFLFLICYYQVTFCQATDKSVNNYFEKSKTQPYNEFGPKLNKEVNYHTGTVNIEIPLYEIKIKDIVSIPIKLTYNTGGIKLTERPGPVGLGWNLQSGGYIQREMRGRSDDGD